MKKLLLLIFFLGFTSYFYPQETGTFKDERDGKIYKTIKIGYQIWFAENLNVEKFRNGDIIPEAKTAEEWKKAGDNWHPAWCYYDNDPENGKKYGKLYNWFAVNDPRGLAPEDWHIPLKEEFETLIEVNNFSNALKTTEQGTERGAGINNSGFSALMAGGRRCDNNSLFDGLGHNANFWCSKNDVPGDNPCAMCLSDVISNLIIWELHSDWKVGMSVRCLKELIVQKPRLF